jgi:hypothetical protein
VDARELKDRMPGREDYEWTVLQEVNQRLATFFDGNRIQFVLIFDRHSVVMFAHGYIF